MSLISVMVVVRRRGILTSDAIPRCKRPDERARRDNDWKFFIVVQELKDCALEYTKILLYSRKMTHSPCAVEREKDEACTVNMNNGVFIFVLVESLAKGAQSIYDLQPIAKEYTGCKTAVECKVLYKKRPKYVIE